MIGLTKTVAREWGGFNIRCNAVTYGYIATRLTSDKDSGASISVGGQKACTHRHRLWDSGFRVFTPIISMGGQKARTPAPSTGAADGAGKRCTFMGPI